MRMLKAGRYQFAENGLTGYNSFVSKISQKATGISNAANRASATYTNNGTYSKTDSSLTSSKIVKKYRKCGLT